MLEDFCPFFGGKITSALAVLASLIGQDINLNSGLLTIYVAFLDPTSHISTALDSGIIYRFFSSQVLKALSGTLSYISPFKDRTWFGKNLKIMGDLLAYLHFKLIPAQRSLIPGDYDLRTEMTLDKTIREQITSLYIISTLTGNQESLEMIRTTINSMEIDGETKFQRIKYIENLMTIFTRIPPFQARYQDKPVKRIINILLLQQKIFFRDLLQDDIRPYIIELGNFIDYHRVHFFDIFSDLSDLLINRLPLVEYERSATQMHRELTLAAESD